MERYYEQSVSVQTGLKATVLYLFCWIGIVVTLLLAAVFAACFLGNEASLSALNWRYGIGMALCLVLAGVLFNRKDYLRVEYDYILQNETLEIYAVLNRKRRKCLARIQIEKVLQLGEIHGNAFEMFAGDQNVRQHSWYANRRQNYIIYMEENIRHIALLEMNAELCALLRSAMPMTVRRGEEGKNENASVSGQ